MIQQIRHHDSFCELRCAYASPIVTRVWPRLSWPTAASELAAGRQPPAASRCLLPRLSWPAAASYPSEKHGMVLIRVPRGRAGGPGWGPGRGASRGDVIGFLKTLFFKKNFILQLLKAWPPRICNHLYYDFNFKVRSHFGPSHLGSTCVMLARSHPKGPSNTTLPHSSSSSCLGWRDS